MSCSIGAKEEGNNVSFQVMNEIYRNQSLYL